MAVPTPHRTDTTLSDLSSNSSLQDEIPGLSRLFQDAAGYGKAIAEICKREGDEATHVQGYADLVGKDVEAPATQLLSERIAKISVSEWSGPDEGLDGPISLEPEAYEEDEGALHGSLDKFPFDKPEASCPLLSGEKISPEQIIKVFGYEFGPLTSPGEEEKLLCEADCVFLQEVAILGMVHLTTHRVTFHASLLSTRPDLNPDQQIIKRGFAIIHRPGLHRKRKVWMELSHDMLCTFPSNKDEDRIKPIKSILLASIQEIIPEDPEHANLVRLKFITDKGVINGGYSEFGTEESARDWRRELSGALYLYRRRRNAVLADAPNDQNDGVRISIPLALIKSHQHGDFFSISSKITLELEEDEHDPSDDHSFDDDSSSQKSSGELDKNQRTLQFAILLEDPAWKGFSDLVAAAKANKSRPPMSSIIDFGALNFIRDPTGTLSGTTEEVSIKHALSMGHETSIWYRRARINRAIASTGYFVVSPRFVGFWSKCFSACQDVKYRLPLVMIVRVNPHVRKYTRAVGFTLELKGHKDLSFDFGSVELRDEVLSYLNLAVENEKKRVDEGLTPVSPRPTSPPLSSPGSPPLTSSPLPDDTASTTSSISSNKTLVNGPSSATCASIATTVLSPLERTISRQQTRVFDPGFHLLFPKVINIPTTQLYHITPRHFVCLTIGSRGDVQPYIALGLGLKKEGHKVTIVTHEEYKEWVEGWGIGHRTAGGDPGALMKLSVEHKMFSPQFFKESLTNFRKWLDDLLVDAWEQCKDAEVLLESPSAMAGVHIAEALGIPYFRTFTMPWTKTAEFPHSFLSPPVESASFNSSSYVLFDNVFWAATSGQVNRWRKHTLGIGPTDMGHLAQSKIPFIYNFSSAVVPKPKDWSDSITVSGYWFLDNPDLGWKAPESLLDWMAKAREHKKPIVYIGFGSITVPNPAAMTRSIVKAVLKSGVYAIISKGWSARMTKGDAPEVEMPPECYSIDKIPHDWLFPQIDAALHHGGAGTTGASLRAGIPTLIKPWFGDQFFWSSRVQKLGAGLRVNSLRSSELAHALTKATTDRHMKERAAAVGQGIRSENGVRNAIWAIYMYLPRAGKDRTTL